MRRLLSDVCDHVSSHLPINCSSKQCLSLSFIYKIRLFFYSIVPFTSLFFSMTRECQILETHFPHHITRFLIFPPLLYVFFNFLLVHNKFIKSLMSEVSSSFIKNIPQYPHVSDVFSGF